MRMIGIICVIFAEKTGMIPLKDIIIAANKACKQDIKQRNRSLPTAAARGVYYIIALDKGYHPADIGSAIRRTRATVLNVAKQTRGYLERRDPITTKVYKQIKQIIDNNGK